MKTPLLGQHFLTRPEIAGWVADAVPDVANSTVLEIGPGKGILTDELLKRAQTVVAIEKDTALIPELRERFADEIEQGKLHILEEDVRDVDPKTCELLAGGYILIANIPYYITGAIMRQFLTTAHQPKHMALLVQKEVAERVVAKDGKHSLLSLSVHAYGTPSYVHTVKAGSFSPVPKVDSAILAVTSISRTNFHNTETEERFFELLHAGFAQKRKVLSGNLKGLTTEEQLNACGVHEKARAEELTLSTWLCLASS